MTTHITVALGDGKSIPQIGLGVWQATPDVAPGAVKTALDAGYRHIDTAAIYRNEAAVGEGLRASNVDRADIFVTTKLWNDAQGYDSALKAFDDSMARLALDYLDLYLIHWPAPAQGLYVETWRALVKLREEGRVRSIGVSNFLPEHLKRIMDETGVKPAINQIEIHPRFQQRALRDFLAEEKIPAESWSPLGKGTLLGDPVIAAIAARHGRSPAQIIIRWHVENGLVVIPKSVTPARIVENLDVFSFRLDDADMAAIAKLDTPDGRIGPHP
jgi:2,5-diketo-D-gluconate reductase A